MSDNNNTLSRQITRQIGSETNKRFLRNLPLFHAGNDMPLPWEDLLKRLDRAEDRSLDASVALSGRGC